MFKISMTLDANVNHEKIFTEETGEILEEMDLKKDIKGEILQILGAHKAMGRCNVDLLVEKNNKYYDHDEFTINVNDDFSDLTFLH